MGPRVKQIVQSSAVLLQAVLLAACFRSAPARPDIDSELLFEVNRIRAIDNHAHPVALLSSGGVDREFDALPVDNMEPASDPLQLRPDDPGIIEAWRALWNYPYNDAAPEHIKEWKQHKHRTAEQH